VQEIGRVAVRLAQCYVQPAAIIAWSLFGIERESQVGRREAGVDRCEPAVPGSYIASCRVDQSTWNSFTDG
jgi:hypothetical protein